MQRSFAVFQGVGVNTPFSTRSMLTEHDVGQLYERQGAAHQGRQHIFEQRWTYEDILNALDDLYHMTLTVSIRILGLPPFRVSSNT